MIRATIATLVALAGAGRPAGLRGRIAFVAGVASCVLLAGCGGPDEGNTDPRNGVVYLDRENCLTGGCYNVTKVCLGPDLIYADTRLSDANSERVIEDAPECEPDTG